MKKIKTQKKNHKLTKNQINKKTLQKYLQFPEISFPWTVPNRDRTPGHVRLVGTTPHGTQRVQEGIDPNLYRHGLRRT